VQALVAVTVVAGLVCLGVRWPGVARWSAADVLAMLAIAVATFLGEQLPVRLRHGSDDSEDFSLTDSVWAAGLVLARPSVLSVGLALGVGVGHGIRRVAPRKIAFNIGQFLVAITAAELVASMIGDRFAAGAVGMLVFFAINVSIVAAVLGAVDGTGFRRALMSPGLLNVAPAAGNTAIGLASAWIWLHEPGAVIVLAIPLAISFVGYRAWARGLMLRRSVRAAG
jgi:hypothetical protein